jgi:7-keto-8-aminopelargonate synthetase-like enzyme
MAPLDKINEIAQKYSAIVVVDDAHAAGVAGKNGRGTAEFFGLENLPNIYQTATLSKAFGVYGGFISSQKGIVQRIREVSSCYLASTALPPAMLAAAIASISIIGKEPELRTVLQLNSKHLKAQIQEMGFSTFPDPTPIIPLFFDSEAQALHLSEFLKKNDIIVPYVKYPVKMDKFIVRITASALHTADQIQSLLDVLNRWRKKR